MKSYLIHVEYMRKGHYKLFYTEVRKKRGKRKKNVQTFFMWTTIKKFKLEAKRLKMKVITEEKTKLLMKEGI